MMDPAQLMMIQQMGMASSHMGVPGIMMPSTSNGSQILAQTAAGYSSPIAGNQLPNISPLAPLGLENYGVLGNLASIAGNAYMTNMFENAGVLPMGNAGSFMQAQRANRFMQMQQEVAGGLAPQDADSFYRTIRGVAALTGQPFNREQRQAARNLSDTLASFGPTLAMFNPELMDAISGPTGSVQAMAAQMMQANRYRVDPSTGQIGYGTESNKELVGQLFDQLYSKDNISKMHGIRAGEAGQLYRQLSERGLIARPESLRDRTISALETARTSGDLVNIANEAGVTVPQNLNDLGFNELDKLRQTSGVQKLLTSSDASNIKTQIEGYAKSISAMREIFGENGNPNAPIPLLINSLEALTSGQMQKFDASKLNTMVRDMQALSQMSGKSIDQMLAMNQANTASLSAMGLGPHAAIFAPTATNISTAHGMAFSEVAGATGFGALSREGAEQAAGNMFARSMASESANMYQTLGRIAGAGGFDENTPEGRRLAAIHEAAIQGRTEYVDPETGQTTRLPMREREIRGLIAAGGATGIGIEDFNLMLGDRTSNLRIAAEDERYQTIAQNMQVTEYMEKERRYASRRISTAAPLRSLDAAARNRVSGELVAAGQSAFNELSTQDKQDRTIRQRTMAEAIKQEALNNGVNLSDEEAVALAENMYGSFENTAVNKFGFESRTAADQVLGERVVENRRNRTLQAKSRARVNEAMSGLGPEGTMTQRLFDAIQKQGERGSDADLETLVVDLFGVENLEAQENLVPELQDIANRKKEIEALSARLDDPTLTAEEKTNLVKTIKDKTDLLQQKTVEVRDASRLAGLDSTEETFGLDDISGATNAARNITHLSRLDRIRGMAAGSAVTDVDRGLLKDEKITESDLSAIASASVEKKLEAINAMTEADVANLSPELKEKYESIKADRGSDLALSRIKEIRRENLGTVEEEKEKLREQFGGALTDIGQLTIAEQEAVIRARRVDQVRPPTAEELADRKSDLADYLESRGIEGPQSTLIAQEQLIAESQLRGLGLIAEGESINSNLESSVMPEDLKERLTAAPLEERAGIVSDFLDKQEGKDFYGTAKELENRRLAAIGYLGTDEGKRAMSEIGVNFETMVDLRSKLLADPAAISKLGASRAAAAAEKSIDAERRLQDLANSFGFNGSIEAMLATGFEASDAAGMKKIEESFNNLTTEQKTKILDKLKADGYDVGSTLTVEDYRLSLKTEMDTAFNDLVDSAGMMEGFQDYKLAASDLGVTEGQYGNLSSLAKLESDVQAEAEINAGKLGITVDDYVAMATGKKEYDHSLNLAADQDTVKKLKERSESNLALREKLKKTGLTDQQIEDKLSAYNQGNEEAEEKISKLRELDNTSGVDLLAKSFGIDPDTDKEGYESFKTMMNEAQGDSDVAQRNQKLLASTLDAVSKIENLTGEDSISKLDSLTDEFYSASSEREKKDVASKYGMTLDDLETMMAHTEFMDLEGVDIDKLSEEERIGYASESLKKLRGKDIQAEVAEEQERQLKLTGTVNVTGVVQGEGTFEDVTGNTVR